MKCDQTQSFASCVNVKFEFEFEVLLLGRCAFCGQTDSGRRMVIVGLKISS